MVAPPYPDVVSTVTLRELIATPSPASEQPKLTFKESCALAVILTSSLLQLHSTPWLGHQLSASDIIFLQTHPGDSALRVHVEHPYVAQTYSSLGQALQSM
jgi:hypothetical protein